MSPVSQTHTQNFFKIGRLVFELSCGQTYRQTDRQTDKQTDKQGAKYNLRPTPLSEVINIKLKRTLTQCYTDSKPNPNPQRYTDLDIKLLQHKEALISVARDKLRKT